MTISRFQPMHPKLSYPGIGMIGGVRWADDLWRVAAILPEWTRHLMPNVSANVFWSVFFALLVGMLFADFWNKDSWIWKTIRSFCQVFVIESITPHQDTSVHHEWLEIRLNLRFVKDAGKADVVIKAHSNIKDGAAQHIYILRNDTIDNAIKDQLEVTVLGVVPVKEEHSHPPVYQTWGPTIRYSGNHKGMWSLLVGSENLIEIQVRWKRKYWPWKLRQTERIPMAAPHIDTEWFGKIYVLSGHPEWISNYG